MKRYNPYKSAFSAAISELSSERAINYYQVRAWQDAQTLVDLPYNFAVGLYTAAYLAYQMGGVFRDFIASVQPELVAQPECMAIAVAPRTEMVAPDSSDVDVIDAEIIQDSLLLLAEPIKVAVRSIQGFDLRSAIARQIAAQFVFQPTLAPVQCAGYLTPARAKKRGNRKPKK